MISAKQLIDYGMTIVGVPYVWGGSDPSKGVDCSGLMQAMYAKFGVDLPRVSSQQARAGQAVNPAEAQPGDLIAFDRSTGRPGVDHIGMYIGGGKMLVAPRTGQNVQVQNVDLNTAVAVRRVAPMDYSALPGGTYKPGVRAKPSSGANITPDPSEAEAAKLPVNDTEIAAAVKRDYGYLSTFLKDAELGPILIKAAKEGWDEARLQGAVTATKWWKTTAAQTRQWDAKWRTDTATARQEIAVQQQQIVANAQRMGVTLDDKRSRDLAVNVLRLGWSAGQVQQALAAEFDYRPTTAATGLGGAAVGNLKQIAQDYVVPLADSTVETWTQQILAGTQTEDNFRQYVSGQAKSMYPMMGPALDSGQTVRQYADPYVQHAAKTLGINPADVSLTDPKWQRALMQADKDGNRTPMTLDQWDRTIKTDPTYGYHKSAGAVEQSAGLASALGRTFRGVA